MCCFLLFESTCTNACFRSRYSFISQHRICFLFSRFNDRFFEIDVPTHSGHYPRIFTRAMVVNHALRVFVSPHFVPFFSHMRYSLLTVCGAPETFRHLYMRSTDVFHISALQTINLLRSLHVQRPHFRHPLLHECSYVGCLFIRSSSALVAHTVSVC